MDDIKKIRFLILLGILTFVGDAVYAQTNEECLDCHLDEELTSVTVTGDTVSAFIDASVYFESIHHQLGMECISCHLDISEIPHEDDLEPANCALCHDEVDAVYRESLHGYALERDNPNAPRCYSCHGRHDIFPSNETRSNTHRLNLPQTCGACHSEYGIKKDPEIRIARAVEIYLGSIHGKDIAGGIEEAATCNDCHGTHNLKGAADTQSMVNKRNIPNTCAQCHEDIYNNYINGIHGKALLAGITDTPVCTDCHGEHSILSTLDPQAQTFFMALSEQICADCHEDPRIINKYGLKAGTLKTYQDSYHGMANVRGSQNASTCVSCHGSHLILPATNVNSTIHPDNVAETCGHCHPNADARFAQSYTHAIISEENNIINSIVKNAYILIIVLVVVGMAAHNAIILSKYILEKYYSNNKQPSIKRFDKHVIVQHIMLTITFTVLVITGFALRFPDAMWVKFLTRFGLSEEVRSLLHRIAAILMIGTAVHHVIYILFTRAGRMEIRSIFLNLQDIRDIKTNILYHLGKAEKQPQFDKYDYSEKVEYWALIWGTIIMILTGFILWFPTYFIDFLPNWAIKVSETIHYYEAWLATLAILVWHFFFVIFHPDEYPMSLSWLTGKMSVKEAKSRHPKWYQKIKDTSNSIEEKVTEEEN